MQPAVAAACCLLAYVLVYRFYARYLGARIFKLDPTRSTPAHEMEDGVDYVPCRRVVLFGHHYASIAGLAPMLGPAIAVIWGWLPGMLWVVLGTRSSARSTISERSWYPCATADSVSARSRKI